MDRFLLCLSLGYPSFDDEVKMLDTVGDRIPFDSIKPVCDKETIMQAQEECRTVHVSENVSSYIVRIISATRSDERIRMGASPRGTKSLYQAAKTWAKMKNRDYVTPDDVKEIVHDVLDHRILVDEKAALSGNSSREILDDIISSVEAAPSLKDSRL